MLKTLAFTLALAVAAPALAAPAQPLALTEIPKPAGPATTLFNGQDLKAWDAWLGYADPALTYKRPAIAPLGATPPERRNLQGRGRGRPSGDLCQRQDLGQPGPQGRLPRLSPAPPVQVGQGPLAAPRDPGAQQRPALPLARRARRGLGHLEPGGGVRDHDRLDRHGRAGGRGDQRHDHRRRRSRPDRPQAAVRARRPRADRQGRHGRTGTSRPTATPRSRPANGTPWTSMCWATAPSTWSTACR
jgi:hypothetical protein